MIGYDKNICKECPYGKYTPSKIMRACVFSCEYGGGCYKFDKDEKDRRKGNDKR